MKIRVTKVKNETSEAVSIHFKQPFFYKIRYKAGQFISIFVVIDGKQYSAPYALSTSQLVDRDLAVTVKREKGDLVSNFLCDAMKPEMIIKISQPYGFWANDFNRHKEIVLIGGGSGISALFSIAKEALYKDTTSKVYLLYCNRNESSIIFKSELEDLSTMFPNRFSKRHVLSDPTDGWMGNKGKITPENTVLFLHSFGLNDIQHSVFFISSPKELMEAVLHGLGTIKIPTANIHVQDSCEVLSNHIVQIPSEIGQTKGSLHLSRILNPQPIWELALSCSF